MPAPSLNRSSRVLGARVLEDVEPVVAIAREHVLLAADVRDDLHAPEVVTSLVDEAADLRDATRSELSDSEAGLRVTVGS